MADTDFTAEPPSEGADVWPMGYLVTWRTYGTWLPGDARGSTSRRASRDPDGMPVRPQLEDAARRRLKHAPVLLTEVQREVVERAIEETAAYRGWTLVAKNARTNHVHVVIGAAAPPEPVMNALKGWATRQLRERGAIDLTIKPWERHGSTCYLWKQEHLDGAVAYVLEAQDGERFDIDDC